MPRGVACDKLAFSVTTAILSLLLFQTLWLELLPEHWQQYIQFVFGCLILVVAATSIMQLLGNGQFLRAADWLMLLFIVFTVLSYAWTQAPDNYLLGLRQTIFAVLLYFVGRTLAAPRSEGGSLWDRALMLSLYAVAVVAVVQLLLWQLGAEALLDDLGLGIKHLAGDWPRLQGSLPGPNHLATFLMIASLWLFWRGRLQPWMMIVIATLIVLTFSRSAILGLATGLTVPYLLFPSPRRSKPLTILLVTVAAALTMLAVFKVEPLRQNFIEKRHTALRLEIWEDVKARFVVSSPLGILVGHGPSTAGPASFFHDDPFIPENWFLQIAYEYGVVGLGLLLAAWGTLVVFAYRNKSPPLMALILAISVNSLFLHPLSDNTVAAMWFYLLLGLGYNVENGAHRT